MRSARAYGIALKVRGARVAGRALPMPSAASHRKTIRAWPPGAWFVIPRRMIVPLRGPVPNAPRLRDGTAGKRGRFDEAGVQVPKRIGDTIGMDQAARRSGREGPDPGWRTRTDRLIGTARVGSGMGCLSRRPGMGVWRTKVTADPRVNTRRRR